MKKLLIVLLTIGAFTSQGHNAKISTFTLRDTGGGWLIEMAFAQATVDAAMFRKLGEQVSEMDTKEYQSALIEYVRENFNLEVDGQRIKLVDGGIMLGSHQTDLKFILPDISFRPERMDIQIPMFGAEYNQTNILRIYRGGSKTTKFFLSADNDFRTSFKFSNGEIISVEQRESSANVLSGGRLGIVGTLMILVLVILAIVKYKKTSRTVSVY